jgi:hypothetical protein
LSRTIVAQDALSNQSVGDDDTHRNGNLTKKRVQALQQPKPSICQPRLRISVATSDLGLYVESSCASYHLHMPQKDGGHDGETEVGHDLDSGEE